MKHNFTYKLLEKMDDDVLSDLKEYAVLGPFVVSNDFAEYSIKITPTAHLSDTPALQKLFDRHMSKYFTIDGHVGSNISRMSPYSYVPEHSDYAAGVYGAKQNRIIKFQIPIITNPGAGLMWKFNAVHKSTALHLEEGGIYAFDNCRIHSSVNFSSEYRYWLTSRWSSDHLIDQSLLS